MKQENMTDHWPDEPDRDEVEAFANELQTRLPRLPESAIQRVETTLQDALRQQPSFHRSRRWAAIGVAASISIVTGLLVMNGRQPQSEAPHAPIISTPPVRDVYLVPVVAVPAPAAPEQPLIALDAYQGLFAN